MQPIEIGQPYVEGKTKLVERGEYRFRAGGHELLLCLRNVTPEEVEAVRSAEAEFALVVFGDVLFFLYRFGFELPWGATPYSWHLMPAGERELPLPSLNLKSRDQLQVILVDAATGLVRAIRAVTFSAQFTRMLHLAIHQQALRPWQAESYEADVRAAYRTYPFSHRMLSAAVARTKGGE